MVAMERRHLSWQRGHWKAQGIQPVVTPLLVSR
jgi:hypothetical protein